MILKENTKEEIRNPEKTFQIVKEGVTDWDKENLIVIGLDSRHKLNYVDLVAIGTINECLIGIREVFKTAIVRNSISIILAHNHPSGEPTFSHEDIIVTDKVRESGKILGISLLDHLVFTQDAYCSARKEGVLA
jgi:DNA repair protein RadC